MAPRFIALCEPRSDPQRSLGHLMEFRETKRMMDLTIVTLSRYVIFFYTERGDPLLQKSHTRDTVKGCLSRPADHHACLNFHAQCSLLFSPRSASFAPSLA